MKRILLSFSIITLSFGINAQNEIQELSNNGVLDKAPILEFNKKEKVDQSSDWYNFARELTNISGSMPYYRYSIFPDSTVQVNYADGIGSVGIHTMGQVFDPTSSLFIFESSTISKSANYTLDSIAIPYRYNRVQFGAPDTLIIQIYTQNAMTFTPAPNWSTPRSYARVSYDSINEKGVNAAKEITVILDNDDSTTAVQRIIQEEVNINVLPGEKVALSYTYRPGNPYNVGDTIDFYIDPLPGNQINGFLVYGYRDESSTLDNDFYNHSIWANSAIRYNISTNGWNGTFIPGTAYGNNGGNYHADVFFKITYDDFSGIKENSVLNHLDVYPNPANSIINVEYDLKQGQRVSLEFTNILGHKVFEESLPINGNKMTVDVSDWAKGMYFYTLLVDGQVAGSSRLIVAE